MQAGANAMALGVLEALCKTIFGLENKTRKLGNELEPLGTLVRTLKKTFERTTIPQMGS